MNTALGHRKLTGLKAEFRMVQGLYSSKSDSRICNKTLSVNDNDNPVDFAIYPNPAFHEMTIDISKLALNEKSKIMIFNTTGQLVFDDQIKVNDTYKVKTSDFNPGCYIISIINSKINIQKKFMILK